MMSPGIGHALPKMYVPLYYISDANTLNSYIDALAAASPPGATTIVLDYGVGAEDPDQLDPLAVSAAVTRARAGGLKVFGYVSTCGGQEAAGICNSLPHAVDDIVDYADVWYAADSSIDGIYLDEGANSADKSNYYSGVHQALTGAHPDKTIMLNSAAAGGFQNDTAIFGSAYIVQTFEADKSEMILDNGNDGYPPASGLNLAAFDPEWDQSRVYMLVGGVQDAEVAPLVQDLAAHGIENFFIQKRTVHSSFNSLDTDHWKIVAGAAYGHPATVTVVGSGTGHVTSTPAGMDCTTGTCKTWAGPGATVTLTASPDAGMTFAGFSGACTSSSSTCPYTPKAGDVVTAEFRRNTTVLITVTPSGSGSGTVTSSAGGINCSWNGSASSGTCAADLSTASPVTLTAQANSGSSFAGFITGTCTTRTATTCEFTPTVQADYRAKFDLVQSFALAASSPTVTTLTGSTGTNTITVTPAAGFSSPVSLSLSGLPAGASATFSPNPVPNGSGSSVLTLTSGSAAPNTYPITVTGEGGGVTRTTTFNWTITDVPPNDVANLTDAFDALDYGKWSVSTKVAGDSADARKGLLILTPAANTGAAGVTVDSRTAYSLLESSATVNALQVVSPTGGINAKFMFHAPGAAALSEVVGFWYEGGTLYAYYYTHGVQVAAGSATYSPDAHAWWRIRHSGSTVYWETSRDRATWVALGQVPQSSITFDLSNGIVGFNVKAFGSGNAAPGQANFTHLNIEPTAIALLKDPFTAIDASKWYVALGTAGSTATASGGVLSLAPEPNNGSGSARLVSMRPYALTGSSIVVKVPQTVASGNVNQIFRVARGPLNYDHEIGFWYENGKLYAFQRAYGTKSTIATLTYSSTTHAWWRIRESAATVYWDTSADGLTWTQRASMSVSGLSFSPAMVSVFMSANEWGTGSPAPGTAKFSNVNAP